MTGCMIMLAIGNSFAAKLVVRLLGLRLSGDEDAPWRSEISPTPPVRSFSSRVAS